MKIDYRSTDKVLIVDISGIPSDLFLKEAKVHLILKVLVKDSRPVNSSRIISSKEFTIDSNSHSIHINIEEPFYYYSGEKIQIVPEIKVIINDSIFFDTKISKKVTKELSRPPKVSENPKKVLNPKDTFEWLYNISCISHRDKVIVAVLMIVGGIVIGINMLIGLHDQMSPENMTYFYSHTDSDGDSNSPFLNALGINGGLGFTIWVMIRTRLRKYMSFKFRKTSWVQDMKDYKYNISHLITGKSRVDLENVTLKVVAGNIEKGKYTRGSGTKKRTVSFKNPVRAIELFSKNYDYIPKETEVSEYLTGELSFLEMYRYLYPELMSSGSHGIDVHWEVQLIHDRLIDQELIGTKDICDYVKFLDEK